MTYNNNDIGKKTKRFYDKTVRKYSTEEIQYSLLPKYITGVKKVFIVPVYNTTDINKYSKMFKNKDKNNIFIVVLSKKKESLFSIYNYGYIYFNDYIKNKKHSYVFIYIDPSQIVNIEHYKSCEGFLSTTTINDINQEAYSSLGNMSIDETTMNKIKYFPHGIDDEMIYRFFLFKSLIDNKIVIHQYFVEKNINSNELDWDKLYPSLSKKKKEYYKIYNNKVKINLSILDKKNVSDSIYIVIV